MSEDEPVSEEYSVFQRVRQILIEPSDAIQSDVLRMKTRLLSFSLLLIVIGLPVIQLFLDNLFGNIPLFSMTTAIFFLIYLISRTKYAVIAGIITTLSLASMPFLFLSVEFNQTDMRVALNLIIWPVIAALFGSQWLTAKFEALFISVQTAALLVYCNFLPEIEFLLALEPIIDQAALSLVVLIFTWSLNYYVTQLEEHKKFLEQRQRELEVYTSVLTHDLGNDMQIVRGHIELLNETMKIPLDKESYMATTLAVSERMSRVIKLFSVVGRASEYDFLETLQTMANRAKQASGGANISLQIEPDIRSADIRPGILLPLVLENLLRNTVDYVGESAVVTIRLGLVEKTLIITYRDNGPGIDSSIRHRIFMKGVTTKGEGKGLGLYLSKRIVESYGGTIDLLEEKERQGAAFLISVPVL
ncbi:MAG: HAMP domain-containing histidine kinase [Candidatus Thorarchaeota archaeon]|nr:HAMP domain-containing histidine kinase [Candidatus Thorarchaeota archaeon]